MRRKRRRAYSLLGLLRAAFVAVFCSIQPSHAGPLPGQVTVNPDNPAWLNHSQGAGFFMCGPGDPEGFLYRGTRNPHGTRTGDQLSLINKLKQTGANAIYLMAVRSHGGDGDPTQNPFIDNDPAKGLNALVLNQWDGWFDEMDNNGIVIFFFFYDDGKTIDHPLWNTGDSVGIAEINFIETIVNHFEHHKNLIWAVKEEYQEGHSQARVSHIAAVIRKADDHDHVIAVHQNHGLVFDFPDDPNIDQFAIQYSGPASQLHEAALAAWSVAAGRYNLNMSEARRHGTGETARHKNWAIALAGAYVMVHGWDIANTPVSDLADCGRLVTFMESTNFNEMSPHDELRYGGTQYVLALPGHSYIAYASNLVGDIGLRRLTAGTYDFLWYDVTNGTTAVQENVRIIDGDHAWAKPPSIGNEVAVYIKRSGTSERHPPTNTKLHSAAPVR